MNREIVPKVKVIMNSAMNEAKSNEDVLVRPEHILIAILLDDNNISVNALKKLNIDVNVLHDKLSEYIREKNILFKNIPHF
jgi:ATP-dependent Clp protease ATP-binding subunit ClpA